LRGWEPALLEIILPWLKLGLRTLVIAVAGPVLVRSSEKIARETGVPMTWIGVILLATATSLPELTTEISAVTLADAPNITVVDVLGSCIFNLLLLVLLDEFSRPEPLFRQIDQGHVLTAGYGCHLSVWKSPK
jgi:cation:H+ antiporter